MDEAAPQEPRATGDGDEPETVRRPDGQDDAAVRGSGDPETP